ncbi:transposase, partial [Rhizobium leguminosarum]|uniref:transposase n=4 Tax=Rhizobium leguminosarum TaxID=384 RepID=UPI001FE1388B
ASGVSHRVKLPRRRNPASYSGQFVTLNFILPMRWRRAALCLKGIKVTDRLLRLPIAYTTTAKRSLHQGSSTIKTSVEEGLLHPDPVHYVTKHLQQGIESDHFRVKKNMPKIGGFRSFNSARRTIAGFEAILWLRKGFGFSGGWTVNDQNDLLARLFGLQKVNKA